MYWQVYRSCLGVTSILERMPRVITRTRAAFIFIFITVLLDMISFGIIIPVFPQLILKLQGGDMAGAAAIFGIFGTAFALMQFIFSPVQGALSDRFGRRPVILLSNLGLGLDYIVMALAPTIPIPACRAPVHTAGSDGRDRVTRALGTTADQHSAGWCSGSRGGRSAPRTVPSRDRAPRSRHRTAAPRETRLRVSAVKQRPRGHQIARGIADGHRPRSR